MEYQSPLCTFLGDLQEQFLPYMLSPKLISCLRRNTTVRMRTICATPITVSNRGQIITECNSCSSRPLLRLYSLSQSLTASVQFFPHCPQSLKYIRTPLIVSGWQHLLYKKMGAVEHQVPPFTLLSPHNSVSSASPSSYRLESCLTTLLKLLFESHWWLGCQVQARLSLHHSLSQPCYKSEVQYRTNADARAPTADSNLTGLRLAEGWVLA